jgi:hypothetical protein
MQAGRHVSPTRAPKIPENDIQKRVTAKLTSVRQAERTVEVIGEGSPFAAVQLPSFWTNATNRITFIPPRSRLPTADIDRPLTAAHFNHARTELIRLDTFTAGSGCDTLRASVTVSQVPATHAA